MKKKSLPFSYLLFYHFLYFVFGFGLFAFTSQGVFASVGTQTQYTGEFSEIKGLSQKDFKSQTRLIEQKPFKESATTFRLRLPENWREQGKRISSFSKNDGVSYGLVAKFSEPPRYGHSSYVEINAFSLNNAVSAFHWLYNYTISNGYSIELIEPASWKVAKISYTTFKGGVSYKVLSKAIIDGPKIYVADFYLPIENLEEFKAFQARVIESYELNGTNTPTEPLKEYELFSICKFDFYRSWSVKVENADNVQNISIAFTREGETRYRLDDDFYKVDGKLKLRLMQKSLNPDLKQEISYLINEIKSADYALGELVESVQTISASQKMDALGIERYALPYQGVADKLDHELWVAVLEGPNYYYFITMTTPDLEKRYMVWAHNIAAFRKIIESIKPL